jgi:hypothetical protein
LENALNQISNNTNYFDHIRASKYYLPIANEQKYFSKLTRFNGHKRASTVVQDMEIIAMMQHSMYVPPDEAEI